MTQQELAAGTKGRYAIEEFKRDIRGRTKTRYRIVDRETGLVEAIRGTLADARRYAERIAIYPRQFPMSDLTRMHLSEERRERPGKVVETVGDQKRRTS